MRKNVEGQFIRESVSHSLSQSIGVLIYHLHGSHGILTMSLSLLPQFKSKIARETTGIRQYRISQDSGE